MKKRTSQRMATSLAVVAALTLMGCASTDSGGSPAEEAGTPVAGGTITAALSGDPQTLDNGLSTGSLTILVSQNIFEGLFALDESNSPQPMLAESYSVSEDGLTYTIPLRENVPFHNGEIVDSADVVASLERWMTISATGIGVANDLDAIDAPDATTVVITLKQPRYSLVSDLAFYLQGAIILPEEIARAAGSNPLANEQIIGTGPYQLETYTAGQRIDLNRFEDYASLDEDLGNLAGAKHAYADELDFVFVTDASQRLNGLKTDQWNWVQNIDADQIDSASNDPNIAVTPSAKGFLNAIFFNHNEASAFSDVKARRALNMIIDKQAFATATFGPAKLWEPLGPSIVPSSNQAMYSEVGAEIFSDHNPEEAKKLFADAGVDGSSPIRIVTTKTYPYMYQWAVLIQGALEEIGIPAEIEVLDYAAMSETVKTEKTSWDLSMTFFSGTVVSPSQINWITPTWPGEYDNPEVGTLLAKYQKSTTPEEAKAVVDEVQALIYEDFPVVPLGSVRVAGINSSKLHLADDWTEVLWNAWLSE